MMDQLFRVACASTMIAAAVACATSANEKVLASPSDAGDDGTGLEDATGAKDAPPPTPTIPDTGSPTCSDAGWCITTLPDSDLRIQDIWPLPTHAFAFAESDSRGAQILEWSETLNEWSYVDDNIQSVGDVIVSSLWSPNKNEVYYALLDLGEIVVEGVVRGYVRHGRRPVPPETAWSWTRHHFDCDGFGMPRIWGASADDVYVQFCKAIYRSNGADGPWLPDYVDDDSTNALAFAGATGTGDDDVWFVGSRARCAVLIHKTPAGYRTVVDGIPEPSGDCGKKGELPSIETEFMTPFGSGFHASAKERFVGVLDSNDIVKIAPNGDGGYALDVVAPPSSILVTPRIFNGIWGSSEEELWFLTSRNNSGGGIVRGTNVWEDTAVFQYSTLVMNGVPNTQPLFSIRGTSNTNLWAVGVDRAFHKTTP